MANAESTEIEGHWADQAKEIIDVDYLLEVFSGQEQSWPREVQWRKWVALAIKLGVANAADPLRDTLIKMQKYIAVTPHALRCPCARGMEVESIADHFPGCDLVPALELKETLLADLDAEKLQLELRRQRIERNWQETKTRAQVLEGTWDPAILTHCPRDFLDLLKDAIKNEIKKR